MFTHPEFASQPSIEEDPRLSAETGRRLHDELHRVIGQLRSLEPEVALILNDADVIQEDRDAARMSLEHARQNVETAQSAVHRFESGTYGQCSRCGQSIGTERLEAIPDTQTCVTCQANS